MPLTSNFFVGFVLFIPKLPSYNIITLAKSINPNKKIKIIGIRKGEKLHEELISAGDFQNCKTSCFDKKYFRLIKNATFELLDHHHELNQKKTHIKEFFYVQN